MRRKIVMAGSVIGVMVALSGVAYAVTLSLTPDGGPAGSTFNAEVACDGSPEVRVRELREGAPQATLPPIDGGVESDPGMWSYSIEARARDLLVFASCDGETTGDRYDVEEPAMFPGPTWASFGGWRPELERTSLIGTDCPPGNIASVTLRGADGLEITETAPIDEYGDWEVPIPDGIPAGEVTATATCGSVEYEPVTFLRGGSAPTVPTPTSPTAPPPPAPSVPGSTTDAPPARPVGAAPSYTG